MSAEAFAAWLSRAEGRLRAAGLTGRGAYAALCRALAARLGLPRDLWVEGPDAPISLGLDRISLTAEIDLFGLAYERFFPEVFKAERGQYFTPLPVIELMADLVGLRPRDRVLDPTCGSGSFLVVAHQRGADVDGLEFDPELVALCQLNLKLHGANPRAVRQADLFRDDPGEERWDVILANPPFSVAIDHPDALRGFSLAHGRPRIQSDVLFLEAAWRRLRPGGRFAAVLPYSLLANRTFASVRAWLDARFVRRAVVSLPEGVFRPFGGASGRACVVCLSKRPAELRPWVSAVITRPGYDPSTKVYRPQEPDEIAALRIDLREGNAPVVGPERGEWLPEQHRVHSGIGPVPCTTLGELAPADRVMVRPSSEPDTLFTEVDLADVDKNTGEVTGGRARPGHEFRGAKAAFSEGDILFARMRPALNNVVHVGLPREGLPGRMCGSTEWVRLCPPARPGFALVAARSPFVRAQLAATSGQTRPRATVDAIVGARVPAPPDEAQSLIDARVTQALDARRRARQELDLVAALYARWGAGEIDDAALLAALQAMGPAEGPPSG